MKHIVSLSPQLEAVYTEAAKILGTSVDEILHDVLEEYIANLIKEEKKALN